MPGTTLEFIFLERNNKALDVFSDTHLEQFYTHVKAAVSAKTPFGIKDKHLHAPEVVHLVTLDSVSVAVES